MKGPSPANPKRTSGIPGPQPKTDNPNKKPGIGAEASLLRRLFSIDPRALAVFRMAMGTLLLADLVIRAGDLGAMYTDGGMFSRMEICRRVGTIWNWSFHFGSGTWGYQAVLFGLAALLAIALLVGFESRLATIGSWLMLVSLQHRVPPILSGADILLRLLLFWGMFLPLGRVWSMDQWLTRRRGQFAPGISNAPVFCAASVAILLQMAMMYFFSAIFKSNDGWLRGEIVSGALAHNFYAKPLGAYLLQFPHLLAVLTWGTFVLEWLGPLLLFSPKFTPWLRMGSAAALAAMHIGISLCLDVDFFSPVSLAGLTLFLPSEFWDNKTLARFFPGPGSTETAVFAKAVRHAGRAPSPVIYGQEAICLVLLIYVLFVNISGLPGMPLNRVALVPGSFLRTACGLGQKWNMFDEVPSRNGWYVATAKLQDGSRVDLLRGGAPLEWNRPSYAAGVYPNHRWRKLFREMAYSDELGYQLFRQPVAEYLCRAWNARHIPEKRVAEFEFVYCLQEDERVENASQVQPKSRERLIHIVWDQAEDAPNR